MRGPRPWNWSSAAAAALVVGLAAPAGSEVSISAEGGASWRPGAPVAIAVTGGRGEFAAPTCGPGARTLVIVSALGRGPGSYPVSLSARPRDRSSPRPPVLATRGPRRRPRLEAPPLPRVAGPTGVDPPRERSFHMLTADGDAASASNYRAVTGALRGFGTRVQVYVDSSDAFVAPELVRDVVATFDERVFPTAARTIGQARDTDGDGRFTVFLSSRLTRLGGGRNAVAGFVRGADLDPSAPAPFGNHCDMMYLSTALTSGPYLRTVLAHEYTHAVTFTAKALGGGRPGLDEEAWLDEAIAHLGEDLNGFSRSNLDYRVSAFLSRPEQYQLVVEDYYAADLFRGHGNRGGTYLFLRWCADRTGPGLLPALVHSDRRGADCLEAVTGVAFADLYRDWSVALFLSGFDPADGDDQDYRTLAVRGPFADWTLAGPRTVGVRPGGPVESWSAAPTSSRYLIVEGSATGGVGVTVSGPPEAELQVTAVALPADLAALELTARLRVGPGPDRAPELCLTIQERQGTAVRLSAVACEPLVPAVDPHAPGFHRLRIDAASACGADLLPARGRLDARPLALPGLGPGAGPLIVKVVGTDARGRQVAGWAEVALDAPSDPADLTIIP